MKYYLLSGIIIEKNKKKISRKIIFFKNKDLNHITTFLYSNCLNEQLQLAKAKNSNYDYNFGNINDIKTYAFAL